MFVMDYWKQFKPISQGWHNLIALSYLFIAVFSFITNLMVIYYLKRVKKTRGKQDGSYFLINLAIVDIGKSVLGLPLVVVSSFKGKWVFGQIGCTYYAFSQGTFGFVSLALLTIMAVERYLIVSNPLKIFESTKTFKIVSLLCAWGYALFWVTLQFGSQHGYVLEGFLTSCSFDYFSRDIYTRVFMTAMILGGFILPLALFLIFYVLTKRALESKSKDFGNQMYVFASSTIHSKTKISKASTENSSNSDVAASSKPLKEKETGENSALNETDLSKINSLDGSVLKKRNNTQTSTDFENKQFSFQKRQQRVLRTILSYIIFFCIAFAPYAIVVLFAQYGSNIEEYINPYTTSLPAIILKTSSIYNPMLYTLNNQDFKNYFKRTFLH